MHSGMTDLQDLVKTLEEEKQMFRDEVTRHTLAVEEKTAQIHELNSEKNATEASIKEVQEWINDD